MRSRCGYCSSRRTMKSATHPPFDCVAGTKRRRHNFLPLFPLLLRFLFQSNCCLESLASIHTQKKRNRETISVSPGDASPVLRFFFLNFSFHLRRHNCSELWSWSIAAARQYRWNMIPLLVLLSAKFDCAVNGEARERSPAEQIFTLRVRHGRGNRHTRRLSRLALERLVFFFFRVIPSRFVPFSSPPSLK